MIVYVILQVNHLYDYYNYWFISPNTYFLGNITYILILCTSNFLITARTTYD